MLRRSSTVVLSAPSLGTVAGLSETEEALVGLPVAVVVTAVAGLGDAVRQATGTPSVVTAADVHADASSMLVLEEA